MVTYVNGFFIRIKTVLHIVFPPLVAHHYMRTPNKHSEFIGELITLHSTTGDDADPSLTTYRKCLGARELKEEPFDLGQDGNHPLQARL